MRPVAMMLVAFCSCGARTGLEGQETPTDAGVDQSSDALRDEVAPDARVAHLQVAIDVASICFLRDGRVRCWGRNSGGAVGDGTFVDRYSPVPVLGLPWTQEVVADDGHFCARLDDGAARCWGNNSGGRLGIGYVSDSGADGGTESVSVPTSVVSLTNLVSLSSHMASVSCAGLANGRYACWGVTGFGALPGLPQPSQHPVPIEIPEFAGATSVTMGADFTCALINGEVECSGRNKFGELGDGTIVERHTLAPADGVKNAIQISCGDGAAYTLLADHTVLWWGVRVGNNGQVAEQRLRPTPLGLSNVLQVATAGLHVCVRLTDGSVQCAGLNDHGQLGDGTLQSRNTMAPVIGLSDVVDIVTNYFNSCAIVKSGALYCWGGNQFGQMANGSSGPAQTTPYLIGGL